MARGEAAITREALSVRLPEAFVIVAPSILDALAHQARRADVVAQWSAWESSSLRWRNPLPEPTRRKRGEEVHRTRGSSGGRTSDGSIPAQHGLVPICTTEGSP